MCSIGVWGVQVGRGKCFACYTVNLVLSLMGQGSQSMEIFKPGGDASAVHLGSKALERRSVSALV
jgi:hypothetical protein